ncbi:(2Fe-2S)-binding protein [Variovorax ureilyticus]|uniref:(2Fe-2S)-binding protein n=1 Tax=Variovorax ureilyticus TaxID=1836198 RepID=A0ABU8VNP8_9BURK
MKSVTINFRLNGRQRSVDVIPRLLLSDFLRHDMGLPGTHVGCEHGVCGACTVMLNGRTVRSCLTLAAQLDGSDVQTVESLGTATAMHPIQQAFHEEHGLQCGFCTPGMLMVAKELLERNASPTEEEVREAISGNLCRCTGYQNIVAAVMSAAAKLRNTKEATS